MDTHCHINTDPLCSQASEVLRRAGEAGVKRILVVGSTPSDSAEAVRLARLYAAEGVFAAVGIHPHDSKLVEDELPEELLKLAEDPRVAAIGETGLDYHYDHSPRDVQRRVFRLHAEWARRTNKPLVIHVREAMEDALALLKSLPFDAARELRLLFHCYAGGLEYMNEVKALDAYISLAGPVTWAKNDALRETAAQAPEDRLLCETDAPWLTPRPYRGKTNEPAFVRFVYETVAEVRGISVEDLCRITDANAERLFGWGSLYA
ncbi:MAG: TatD family hydrolase [Synergistaceae bacterium]|jgi:TatD DNase family protein|nr:TatD family hydrolase [Synergistaceae bacterium]